MSVSSVATRLTNFVDWFIPSAMLGDRDRVNQARVFLISHLFGPILGSAVPAALYIIDPTPGYQVAVLAASIWGFWAFPILLRQFGHYETLCIVSVENLIFCILWSCYFYGGINSPTVPWVMIIPLLSFFYIGSSNRLRMIVISLFAANLAVFFFALAFFPPKMHAIPAGDIEALGIISTVAVALYVTMMALYYAKVYESQAELEAEMRQHLATADELKQATAEAERAGAAKAEFLAKMSHELRTPLNAVIGYSEMLLEAAEDEGDAETIGDLKKINSAGHHLLRLINEVLDLSKIDAGMMEVYRETTFVPELIREVVDEYRAAATENGNVVIVELGDTVTTARLDQMKVRQVLGQIIDNAVKFTKGGIVSIHVSRVPHPEADRLRIAVKDTGIGIAENEVHTLFEQFTVLGDASSSKYGGTGLGLALSQKLCRLMGGDIEAVSKLGEGSCFTVTLPVHGPGKSNDAPLADQESFKEAA